MFLAYRFYGVWNSVWEVNIKLQAKLTEVEFLYLLYWSSDFLSFF